MKTLHYQALYPAHISQALEHQIRLSFQPYLQYLQASIHHARQQETASFCHWESVEVDSEYTLHPKDELISYTLNTAVYRIKNWTSDIPSTDIPLFSGTQFEPIEIVDLHIASGDLIIQLMSPIDCRQKVLLMNAYHDIELENTALPLQVFARDHKGQLLDIRWRESNGNTLLFVVESHQIDALYDESGKELPFERVSWQDQELIFSMDGADIIYKPSQSIKRSQPIRKQEWIAHNQSRWQLRQKKQSKNNQIWIQLLLNRKKNSDDLIDPRAIYCNQNISEVYIKGKSKKSIKVLGIDQEQYRLRLAELPPQGKAIYLPSNTAGLVQQKSAFYNLKERPLNFQQPLLRLAEQPKRSRWNKPCSVDIDSWYLLYNDNYPGTKQQREFVRKSIGTSDFAFLEGPPGSGKTHAICELILQCIERGLKVLICSATHVAVDNVLERLLKKFEQVEAIRIGLVGRVDPCVKDVQIDQRIENIILEWQKTGFFNGLSLDAKKEMAQDLLLKSVNLTCATSTGILSHPYFRNAITARKAHFDILIIDEASKSTVQEFLVPAQLCQKWIIVGDIQQLPPFSNPKDLEASLADISFSPNNNSTFKKLPLSYQRALFLYFTLIHNEKSRTRRHRYILKESDDVAEYFVNEHLANDHSETEVLWVTSKSQAHSHTVQDLIQDPMLRLRFIASDIIICTPEVYLSIKDMLPSDILHLSDTTVHKTQQFRFDFWHQSHGTYKKPIKIGGQKISNAREYNAFVSRNIDSKTWASEIAWRISRKYSLNSLNNTNKIALIERDLERLLPSLNQYDWVHQSVHSLGDVGVRSIIETLKSPLLEHLAKRNSALTDGLSTIAWKQRAVTLQYQHRMHPDISQFPRAQFYNNNALIDAPNLLSREDLIGWRFKTDLPNRRLWVDINGRESHGVNQQEINEMKKWLIHFQKYAMTNHRKDGQPWEIACLSFYNKQNIAIRDMLRQLTGQNRSESRFRFPDVPNLILTCATVDRFQGREADAVFLSMRNTNRVGHIDSPNRLNVSLTRSRFLLVIFGKNDCYSKSQSIELRNLAQNTYLYRSGVKK